MISLSKVRFTEKMAQAKTAKKIDRKKKLLQVHHLFMKKCFVRKPSN